MCIVSIISKEISYLHEYSPFQFQNKKNHHKHRNGLNKALSNDAYFQLDGRSLINIFVELPSKKEYPDYYQVISEPIDMKMIEYKIKQSQVRLRKVNKI